MRISVMWKNGYPEEGGVNPYGPVEVTVSYAEQFSNGLTVGRYDDPLKLLDDGLKMVNAAHGMMQART